MKKLFMKKAPKEASAQENKEYLESIGVSTHKSTRESKFAGFSDYAREVAAKGKKDYNTRDNAVSNANDIQTQQESQAYGAGGNPYARQREQRQYDAAASAGKGQNPYANNAYLQSTPGNPYAAAGSAGGSAGGNPYQSQQAPQSGSQSGQPGQSSQPSANPYAQKSSYNPMNDAASIAPSAYSAAPADARNELFGDTQYRKKEFDFGNDSELDELNGLPQASNPELDELNDLPDQDRASNPYSHQPGQGHQKTQEEQEDEEVEELRQQIKFTKKESLSSTQNTLRLAAEAEASGRNALGMLGSQGERIANTERSLALAKNQSKIATEKSAELARLNRSIFVPNVSNPFTSKRRLHEKEARIKSEYLQEQVAREHRRQTAFESERRVLDGLNSNGVSYSDTAMKHRKEQMRNSEGRKKFQFEADSEDEEIEDEIELNLEGISNAAGRMKNLALGMGEEVESQNKRLDRVTRQTDELDVDVHLNAARLAAIK